MSSSQGKRHKTLAPPRKQRAPEPYGEPNVGSQTMTREQYMARYRPEEVEPDEAA